MPICYQRAAKERLGSSESLSLQASIEVVNQSAITGSSMHRHSTCSHQLVLHKMELHS
jgi:hypothetical protein